MLYALGGIHLLKWWIVSRRLLLSTVRNSWLRWSLWFLRRTSNLSARSHSKAANACTLSHDDAWLALVLMHLLQSEKFLFISLQVEFLSHNFVEEKVEFLAKAILANADFAINELLDFFSQTVKSSSCSPCLHCAHQKDLYLFSPLKTLPYLVSAVGILNFLNSLVYSSSQYQNSLFVLKPFESFLNHPCLHWLPDLW